MSEHSSLPPWPPPTPSGGVLLLDPAAFLRPGTPGRARTASRGVRRKPAMSKQSLAAVLFVGGNDPNQAALAPALREAGFDVKLAGTADEALERLREEPELIILASGLPDGGGPEFCRTIKADPRTAPIPLLHLGGPRGPGEAWDAGRNGHADGYLAEPVDPAELLSHVHALLRLGRSEAALQASEARLRDILDHAPVVAYVKDLEGRYHLVNRRWETLFHVGRDEVVGKTTSDVHPPEECRGPAGQRPSRPAGRRPPGVRGGGLPGRRPAYLPVREIPPRRRGGQALRHLRRLHRHHRAEKGRGGAARLRGPVSFPGGKPARLPAPQGPARPIHLRQQRLLRRPEEAPRGIRRQDRLRLLPRRAGRQVPPRRPPGHRNGRRLRGRRGAPGPGGEQDLRAGAEGPAARLTGRSSACRASTGTSRRTSGPRPRRGGRRPSSAWPGASSRSSSRRRCPICPAWTSRSPPSASTSAGRRTRRRPSAATTTTSCRCTTAAWAWPSAT